MALTALRGTPSSDRATLVARSARGSEPTRTNAGPAAGRADPFHPAHVAHPALAVRHAGRTWRAVTRTERAADHSR